MFLQIWPKILNRVDKNCTNSWLVNFFSTFKKECCKTIGNPYNFFLEFFFPTSFCCPIFFLMQCKYFQCCHLELSIQNSCRSTPLFPHSIHHCSCFHSLASMPSTQNISKRCDTKIRDISWMRRVKVNSFQRHNIFTIYTQALSLYLWKLEKQKSAGTSPILKHFVQATFQLFFVPRHPHEF